jgi:hypothetical protein
VLEFLGLKAPHRRALGRRGYFATVIVVRAVRPRTSGWYMASTVAGMAVKLPSMVARAW